MASDLRTYADSMAAIRDRINKVQTIMAGKMGTGDKDLDAELIFTQFRKVIEGIAYALLSANRIHYSTRHYDVETAWKAKQLIQRIEKVNPNFYPIPLLEPLVYVPGFRHYERVADGFLTQDDFVLLYQGSSEVMHARNPYSTKTAVINVKYTVQQWVSRVQKLLSLHAVQIPSGGVWLARIPGEGPVQVCFAAAMPAVAAEAVEA